MLRGRSVTCSVWKESTSLVLCLCWLTTASGSCWTRCWRGSSTLLSWSASAKCSTPSPDVVVQSFTVSCRRSVMFLDRSIKSFRSFLASAEFMRILHSRYTQHASEVIIYHVRYRLSRCIPFCSLNEVWHIDCYSNSVSIGVFLGLLCMCVFMLFRILILL